MSERFSMWCEECRQSDTDPRHHVLESDGSVTSRHMDCCRDTGCIDGKCHEILTASGEKRYGELLNWITKNVKLQTEPVVLKKENS